MQKSVLPSLREKKRYLVFEIISKNEIEIEGISITQTINQSALDFLGELGYGCAGINIMHDKWQKNTQRGILRVSHMYVNEIRSALMLIKNINNVPVILRTVGISGILKRAKRKYLLAE